MTGTSDFRGARERPLKRVTVHIGHARQCKTAGQRHGAGNSLGREALDPALGNCDSHVAGDPLGQQRPFQK